jgi:hypothetical protein
VPRGAPLHFLHELRAWYLATYNDRFFAPPPAPVPSFFPLFALLELVMHLPVSLWAVARLRRPLGGPAELLLLLYGFETALTTATCMYDAWLWDPALVSDAQKTSLLGTLYGPYLAIATVLTVDMYARLLKRLNTTNSTAKKLQ